MTVPAARRRRLPSVARLKMIRGKRRNSRHCNKSPRNSTTSSECSTIWEIPREITRQVLSRPALDMPKHVADPRLKADWLPRGGPCAGRGSCTRSNAKKPRRGSWRAGRPLEAARLGCFWASARPRQRADFATFAWLLKKPCGETPGKKVYILIKHIPFLTG